MTERQQKDNALTLAQEEIHFQLISFMPKELKVHNDTGDEVREQLAGTKKFAPNINNRHGNRDISKISKSVDSFKRFLILRTRGSVC